MVFSSFKFVMFQISLFCNDPNVYSHFYFLAPVEGLCLKPKYRGQYIYIFFSFCSSFLDLFFAVRINLLLYIFE